MNKTQPKPSGLSRPQSSAKTVLTASVFGKALEQDIDECARIWNEIDEKNKGFINYHELKMGLERAGIEFTHENVCHKLLSDLDIQSGYIRFAHFLKIYMLKKSSGGSKDDKEDILDAYVSLGGMDDGGGNVDADKLIDIIKNEFGLTIDIEGQIRQIDEDGSGEIEFDEFKTLLANDGNNPEIQMFGDWFGFDKDKLFDNDEDEDGN